MTAVVTHCRQCGNEFKPDHAAILAGSWRTCPTCQPSGASEQPAAPTHCEACGRTLRAGARTLCYSCLTGGTGL
jgi:hypothetical protein